MTGSTFLWPAWASTYYLPAMLAVPMARDLGVSTLTVFAAGLTALALAQSPVGLLAAWVLLGVGMGSGLYEAAFATLVRLYGSQSRTAITGITLFAGFASTVGWPLSASLEGEVGWRGVCLVWAALHLVLFGPHGYGLRQSMLMVPARIAQASAPFVFGVLIDRWGQGALWVSSGLGLVAFAALCWLAARVQHPGRAA